MISEIHHCPRTRARWYLPVKGDSKRRAAAILLYGLTTNTLLLVSVPLVVVTVMGPVVAPAGITTFMKVDPTSLISVAATPLKNTWLSVVKPSPSSDTVIPTRPYVLRYVTNGDNPISRRKMT